MVLQRGSFLTTTGEQSFRGSLKHSLYLFLEAPTKRGLHFDFNVDTGREVEAHERVNRLWRWFDDIYQALMNSHLVLIARILMHERRLIDCKLSLLCWQRDWTNNVGAGALRRLNNRASRLVNDFMVVRQDFDANTRLGVFRFFYILA